MPSDVYEGDSVSLFFRPENIKVKKTLKGKEENIIEGKIKTLLYLGDHIDCHIEVGSATIRAQIPAQENLRVNEEVFIQIDPNYCMSLHK